MRCALNWCLIACAAVLLTACGDRKTAESAAPEPERPSREERVRNYIASLENRIKMLDDENQRQRKLIESAQAELAVVRERLNDYRARQALVPDGEEAPFQVTAPAVAVGEPRSQSARPSKAKKDDDEKSRGTTVTLVLLAFIVFVVAFFLRAWRDREPLESVTAPVFPTPPPPPPPPQAAEMESPSYAVPRPAPAPQQDAPSPSGPPDPFAPPSDGPPQTQ